MIVSHLISSPPLASPSPLFSLYSNVNYTSGFTVARAQTQSQPHLVQTLNLCEQLPYITAMCATRDGIAVGGPGAVVLLQYRYASLLYQISLLLLNFPMYINLHLLYLRVLPINSSASSSYFIIHSSLPHRSMPFFLP